MEAEMAQAADEIKRLKACINNLISVQALPAIWSGGQPSQIVSALLDMLPKLLSLDFAYVRLKDSTGGGPPAMGGPPPDRTPPPPAPTTVPAPDPWVSRFSHPSPLHL